MREKSFVSNQLRHCSGIEQLEEASKWYKSIGVRRIGVIGPYEMIYMHQNTNVPSYVLIY